MICSVENGNGYDHNFVLNTKGDLSTVAARLSSPESGIVLEVYTDEPGIQVYTGNFLDGTVKGKKGSFITNGLLFAWKHNIFPILRTNPDGRLFTWNRGRLIPVVVSINFL